MRLLLDTHVILWMIADDPRLPEATRQRILAADGLAWSTASLWEIAIKLSPNRPDFRLGPGWERLIPEEMTRNGIHRFDLQPAHCVAVSRLPRYHRDPFDRMLAAQAGCDKRSVMSSDPVFVAYSVERVW